MPPIEVVCATEPRPVPQSYWATPTGPSDAVGLSSFNLTRVSTWLGERHGQRCKPLNCGCCWLASHRGFVRRRTQTCADIVLGNRSVRRGRAGGVQSHQGVDLVGRTAPAAARRPEVWVLRAEIGFANVPLREAMRCERRRLTLCSGGLTRRPASSSAVQPMDSDDRR